MDQQTVIHCPLCHDLVDKGLYRFHLDSERVVIDKIRDQHPGWSAGDSACSRCVDYYHTEIIIGQRILPEIGPHFSIRTADDFVILPTGLRINTDPRFTGRGITICFIDSGFYPHPDLQSHRNRIKCIIDMTDASNQSDYFNSPHSASWHGTMTSVVCAGDGYLTGGLYKGIASEAELVLLKVQDASGRISTASIVAALKWLLANHRQYQVRIVNMSLGDESDRSYLDSEVDQLAEKLIDEGLVIVAAAGNDENQTIRPPANSLNVIAVGGLNDNNKTEENSASLYHSSYGLTIDKLHKPELIAPAIWLAAPILPGTPEAEESMNLHRLLSLPDEELGPALTNLKSNELLNDAMLTTSDNRLIREAIVERIQRAKYISEHFMHVDGTSFAAPIITGIVAQMLEANPALNPAKVREALFSMARRIDHLPAERQGFGVVQARKSLIKILKREQYFLPARCPELNLSAQSITFYVYHDSARQIVLAGSFNQWANDVLLLTPGKEGLWKIEIPMLPAGKYLYKFLVDEEYWIEDFQNPRREPDGYSGFNSILTIEN